MDLETALSLIRAQAAPHRQSFFVGLDSQHLVVISEKAARPCFGQLKGNRGLLDRRAIFIRHLNHGLLGAVLLNVIDGALAFLNHDLDGWTLDLSRWGQEAEDQRQADSAIYAFGTLRDSRGGVHCDWMYELNIQRDFVRWCTTPYLS